MLFSFEPTPDYLSENLREVRRMHKSSSGVFSEAKTPRRSSQDKREGGGTGAARARAESASIGRAKWENADETQASLG